MKPAWRRWLYRAGLIVGAGLLAAQFWAGLRSVQAAEIQVAQPLPLAAGLALIFLANSLQMLAWLVLMRGLGAALPLGPAFAGYMLSSLARYLPGGVWGYVSRSQWLNEAYGVSYGRSASGSVIEVLGFVASALALAAGLGATRLWGMGRLALVALAVGLPALFWLAPLLARRFAAARPGRIGRWLARLGQGVPARHWAAALLLQVMFWVCLGAALLAIASALGAPQPGGLLMAASVYSAAWLAGLLVVFVPAGLGIREAALTSLLVGPFAEAGGTVGAASLIALTMRLLTLVAELASMAAWWAVSLVLGPGRPPVPEQRPRA